MLSETPDDRIVEIYGTKSFYESYSDKARLEKLRFEMVSDDVFKKMSDTVTPQGVLVVVKSFEYKLEDIIDKKDVALLMLEDIQDPGNLGTLIRTAEGAGMDGIIMSKGTVDIYSPKVIRSTMGAIYRMPFLYVDSMPALEQKLAESGIKVCAAALGHDTCYTKADLTGSIGILIGNEGNGLTKEAIEGAGAILTIPMEGKLESLNAAISGGVIMYEAYRQRHL